MKGVYEACYYGGLALAILFVIAAIALFIIFKIPKVFGDLTGRNAKKIMKSMNEPGNLGNTESKKERAKYYNEETGKIRVRQATVTEKKKGLTDALKKTVSGSNRDTESTEVLSSGNDADNNETELLVRGDNNTGKPVRFTDRSKGDEATDVLRATEDDDKTDVLRATEDDDKTDVLRSTEDDDKTDVLRSTEDDDKTDVLRSTEDDNKTDVLRSTEDDDKTDVLRSTEEDDKTDVLRATEEDDKTDVLRTSDTDNDSTTILSSGGKSGKLSRKAKVIYNVVEVHTEETI